MHRIATTAFAVLLLCSGSALGQGAGGSNAEAEAGLDYLLNSRTDGRFPTWVRLVAEAAAQAGHDIKIWPSPDDALFDRLEPTPPASCPPTGAVYNANLRMAHAVGTSGYDPRSVHGVNLYACVRAGFDGTQSGDPQTINDDVWAILALRAGGVGPGDNQIRASADVVRLNQKLDGGWSFNSVGASSTDLTGMALVALAAADELTEATAASARAFLDSTRDGTGGHRDLPGSGVGVNCQSTLWAVHGYHAAGIEPLPATLDYLASLQNPDGGFARKPGGASDAFCTAEAIPVAAGSLQPWPRFTPGSAGSGNGDPFRQVRQAFRAVADVPGDILDATWTIRAPDGASTQRRGLDIEHAFTAVGLHDVALHAIGPDTVLRDHVQVNVVNRPPAFAPMARLTADRVTPLSIDPLLDDEDGDTVNVSWQLVLGARVVQGMAPAEHTPATLGIHTLRLTADDGYDQVQLVVPVDVINLPPSIAGIQAETAVANQPFRLSASATDPDGPAPDMSWLTPAGTSQGPSVQLTLGPGDYQITLQATDADGAVAERTLSLHIAETPESGSTNPAEATSGTAVPASDHIELGSNGTGPVGAHATDPTGVDSNAVGVGAAATGGGHPDHAPRQEAIGLPTPAVLVLFGLAARRLARGVPAPKVA